MNRTGNEFLGCTGLASQQHGCVTHEPPTQRITLQWQVSSSFDGTVSWLIRNFSLDEFRQQRQRFLPTEIASLDRNGCGDPFLRDVQLGSAEYLLQGDRRLHFSRQVHVVEFVRVTDALVRRQFEIGSSEGMALTGGEIGERHRVSAADFGVQVMNLARESVRWKPLGHCIGIEELSINFLRRRAEHPVESDGACVV